MLRRYAAWTYERERRVNRSLVALHEGKRALRNRTLAMGALGVAVIVGNLLTATGTRGPWPLAIALGVGAGLLVARAGLSYMMRAHAYRDGWLSGRSAIYASLTEAMRRNIGPDEWIRAELERDWHVIASALPPDVRGEE